MLGDLIWPPGSTPVIILRPPAPPTRTRTHSGPRRPRQPAHRGARRPTQTRSRRRPPLPASRQPAQPPCVIRDPRSVRENLLTERTVVRGRPEKRQASGQRPAPTGADPGQLGPASARSSPKRLANDLANRSTASRQGLVFYERLESVDPGSARVLGQLGGPMARADAWDRLGGMVQEKELTERRVQLDTAGAPRFSTFSFEVMETRVGAPECGRFAAARAARSERPCGCGASRRGIRPGRSRGHACGSGLLAERTS